MTTNTDRLLLGLAAALWLLMATACENETPDNDDDVTIYERRDHYAPSTIYNGHHVVDRRNAVTSPINTQVASPAGTDEAIDLIRDLWAERLGAESLTGRPLVRWFDTELEGRGLLYPTWQPHHVVGVLFRSTIADEIHLLDDGRSADSFCDTALVHEMLHWVLYKATGNPQSNHVGPLWAPDVMHEVCGVIRGAGL